jgi:hypothetical protein
MNTNLLMDVKRSTRAHHCFSDCYHSAQLAPVHAVRARSACCILLLRLSILFSFSSTNSPVLEHQETHPTVGRHPTPVSSSQEYLPLRSYNSCSSLPDPRSIQNGERNAGIQRARRRSLRKDHEPRQETSGKSTLMPRSPLRGLGSLTILSSSVLLL